ncbi:MAG: thiamine diphosphokinase [Breznakibacter sp.]|nr:thiamine diphosphokinase [Breznakibacter sp.]
MSNEVVILADGAFPKEKRLLDIIRSASFLICCDGAITNLLEIGIEPHLIIGDLDSISPSLKQYFSDRIVQIDTQDTNDLTKAAEWASEHGYKKAIILGANGKRDDHSIANIFLLRRYQYLFESVLMLSDYGSWRPIKESTKFVSFKGQQVSIFSPLIPEPLYSENLKYPLNGLVLSELFVGTLNESLGDWFSLSFEKGEHVVFQTNEPKY